MDKRILEFVISILFKGWKAFEGVAGIILAITTYLIPVMPSKSKLVLIIGGIALIFIVKVIKQFYLVFLSFNHPIKVLRKVQGDGGYKGKDIIVLNEIDWGQNGMLMTLFCNSSGAEQPICLIEILSCVKGEPTTAIQISPDPDEYSIDKYFEEESRRKSLYARTIINNNVIDSFQNIQSKTWNKKKK